MNDMPNNVNVESNKPRNKLLLFGGIGCLLVGLLCVGGLGVTAYFGMSVGKQLMSEMASIEADIIASPEVEAELGSPLTFTPGAPQQSSQPGAQSLTVTGSITGPNGEEGSYTATIAVDGFNFERQSLVVEANGKQIDVSGGDELDLGIELGE
jgi:hypothetical protein